MRYVKCCLLVFALFIHAQQLKAEVLRNFVEFGIHFGGDYLPTTEMAGQGNEDIQAGGLLTASIGRAFPVTDSIEFMASIGLKLNSSVLFFNFIDPDTVTLSVTTFNLAMAYRINDHRIGLGLLYHHEPTLVREDSDATYDPNTGQFSSEYIGRTEWEFDSALGYSLDYDYFIQPDVTIGIRGTFIEYQYSTLKPVDADSVGAMLRIFF